MEMQREILHIVAIHGAEEQMVMVDRILENHRCTWQNFPRCRQPLLQDGFDIGMKNRILESALVFILL